MAQGDIEDSESHCHANQKKSTFKKAGLKPPCTKRSDDGENHEIGNKQASNTARTKALWR